MTAFFVPNGGGAAKVARRRPSWPLLRAALHRERLGPFLLVFAAHAAPLWWLTLNAEPRPEPMMIAMPSVIGVLVSEAPVLVQPQTAPPVPETPPEPVAEPKPQPRPEPRPAPVPPAPKAPPSERAVTAPPPEPERPLATEPVELAQAAPPAATPSTAPAQEAQSPPPVIPPRSDAAHLNNPAPVYPPESRRRREQGRVLFEVYVQVDGSVGEIRLKQSSGSQRLDDAALDAVKRWRYVPARRGGEPIPYWYAQPVDFVLNP